MNQFPRCDWLPERARWGYTARSGFLAWSRKIKDHFFGVLFHIINPLLTKLVRSRWLDIGLVLFFFFFFFFVFMDLDFVSVHKHAKKTWPISSHPGTNDPEPTTLLCSCNGVFTDQFIFRLNFPRMRLPQEPHDQLQEIKLTS